MIYQYRYTLLLLLLTASLGLATSRLEATFSAASESLMLAQKTDPGTEKIDPKHQENTLTSIPWFCAGAFIGGFACVGFRKLKDKGESARYFGVSVAVSIFTAPMMVYSTDYLSGYWYTCLFIAGVCATFAWGIMEIMTILFASLKQAVVERGVAGLRDQLLLIITFGTVGRQVPQQPPLAGTVSISTVPAPKEDPVKPPDSNLTL